MGGYDVLRILLDKLTDPDLPKLTKFSWLSNLITIRIFNVSSQYLTLIITIHVAAAMT